MGKTLKKDNTFYTPKQAADLLNLSLSTIKRYIYKGVLKSYKTPGGHHRIRKEDLMEILN